jgi:hypothetical protein
MMNTIITDCVFNVSMLTGVERDDP